MHFAIVVLHFDQLCPTLRSVQSVTPPSLTPPSCLMPPFPSRLTPQKKDRPSLSSVTPTLPLPQRSPSLPHSLTPPSLPQFDPPSLTHFLSQSVIESVSLPSLAQLSSQSPWAFPPSHSSTVNQVFLFHFLSFSILPLLNFVCEVRFYLLILFLNCFVLNIFVVERVFFYFVDLHGFLYFW